MSEEEQAKIDAEDYRARYLPDVISNRPKYKKMAEKGWLRDNSELSPKDVKEKMEYIAKVQRELLVTPNME